MVGDFPPSYIQPDIPIAAESSGRLENRESLNGFGPLIAQVNIVAPSLTLLNQASYWGAKTMEEFGLLSALLTCNY